MLPTHDATKMLSGAAVPGAPLQRRLPSRRKVDGQRGIWTSQWPAADCATNLIEAASNKTSLAHREHLNDDVVKHAIVDLGLVERNPTITKP